MPTWHGAGVWGGVLWLVTAEGGSGPWGPDLRWHLRDVPSSTVAPYSPADLIELMMIQNSQMYQVVMNSLAVSALTSFGFGPSPPLMVPLQTGEEEEAMVFHHHYVPYTGPTPILAWPVPAGAGGPVVIWDTEGCAVPPPPPPSATGTVGANVPPSSGEDKFSP
uniref:DUF4587 domain-containing protein n=1 Tax=Anser brachyrhynchus TaxID=132585 RepID=A0A8B9C5F4_9AVES